MARPTKLTDEVEKKILDALRGGAYIETAAAYAGIDRTTFQRWLKRGARAKRGIYREFCIAVEKAMADAEMRDILNINVAAQGRPAKHDEAGNVVRDELRPCWQASAWRLERKYPKKWGRKQMIRVEDLDEDEKGSMFEGENFNTFLSDAIEEIESEADIDAPPATDLEDDGEGNA